MAGDTVILMDGLYEQGSVNFNRSGTSSKRITYRAQNKWGAVVSSTSGCQPGFSITASYITVQDLRFSVSPRNANCGSYTSSNVHIRAWDAQNPTPSNPTSGYVGFVASGIKVDSTLARSEGVKSNQDFTVIENSEFGSSIELFNVKDSIIRNNTVIDQNLWGISIFVKGGVRNTQIYNNTIRNKFANGYAIYLGGSTSDPWHFDGNTKFEAYNSVAYNNVIVNDSNGGMTALIFAGARDSAFYNNVVVGGSISMIQGGGSGTRATTTNPRIQNNIVTCRSGAAAITGNHNGTMTISNNNFHNCSNVPAQNSPVSGDPLLVNPSSDWRLQTASPGRNTGASLSMTGYDGLPIDVSRDRSGVVRTAPWDLGIYNY